MTVLPPGEVDHLPHTSLNLERQRGLLARSTGMEAPSWPMRWKRIAALHDAETVAAVIVEPMAGSTGVWSRRPGYLERLGAICDPHGFLLIFDEVITGFGRLGRPFAAEPSGWCPT